MSLVTSFVLLFLYMEINPEFRVAELDYENNVARCDVNYTRNAIDVTNCVHVAFLLQEPELMIRVWNALKSLRYKSLKKLLRVKFIAESSQ